MSAEVIHGDCLEVMRGMADTADVDAIITDPPYGVGLGHTTQGRGGAHGLKRRAYLGFEDTYEQFVSEVVPRLNAALDIAPRAAVFSGPHIQEQRKAAVIGGVYSSAGTGRHKWGFKLFHPILLYGTAPDLHRQAKRSVLQSNARSEANGHPCPKPLEWMLWLVELATRPGDLVLDPFCGSGTTGVACVMLGRRFIGIEREAAYVAIARRRTAEARSQLGLGVA